MFRPARSRRGEGLALCVPLTVAVSTIRGAGHWVRAPPRLGVWGWGGLLQELGFKLQANDCNRCLDRSPFQGRKRWRVEVLLKAG